MEASCGGHNTGSRSARVTSGPGWRWGGWSGWSESSTTHG